VVNEEHLRRILVKFTAYYNHARTHTSLGKDAPHAPDRTLWPCCCTSDPWRATPSLCSNLVFGSDKVTSPRSVRTSTVKKSVSASTARPKWPCDRGREYYQSQLARISIMARAHAHGPGALLQTAQANSYKSTCKPAGHTFATRMCHVCQPQRSMFDQWKSVR
jgi:hypothetical protein